jgi:hypothetical protein
MQLISGSVGDGGTNKKSDVALVQAILMKTQRSLFRAPLKAPITGPYLTSYDGDCGGGTKAALRAFQDDHVFQANGGASQKGELGFLPPGLGVVRAKPGLVEPNDTTWQKLLEKVPAEFSDMRVLPNGKTVYLAGDADDLHDSLADAGGKTFEPNFLRKVIACITNMYRQYGIVISVCDKGDRRDFQTQDEILHGKEKVTNAGPGESNHNFGMAVDLGFEGLKWMRQNGIVVTKEDSWMHKLDPTQHATGEALVFWEALRATGTTADVGMFRGPKADHPHLQNWSDAHVDPGRSLVDLLIRSGTMKWSATYNKAEEHYHYHSDLGLGGDRVDVGTASQIWNEESTLTLATLEKLRHAAAKKAGKTGKDAPAAATAADLTAMKKSLLDQFVLADQNWPSWQPK